MSNSSLIKIVVFLNKNLSFAPNCKWKAPDYANLLSVAIGANTYMETVKTESLPNPDTVHRKIEQLTTSNIHESFQMTNKKPIKSMRNKRLIAIFDETHVPFFGQPTSPWIHEYKPEKGCTGLFKFLVISVLYKDKRYFIDAVPLSLFSNRDVIIDLKLKELKRMFKIEAVLMDRGFCSAEIIKILEENG